MLKIDVPGHGSLEIDHLVLDVNGTIACDGMLAAGVAEGIEALRPMVRIIAITADTHGTAVRLREQLGIDIHVIAPGDEAAQKLAFVESLGPGSVAAAGNGANDAPMLAAAALGIGVIGDEGAAAMALSAADVVVGSASGLFGLLRNPARLRATLRR